MGLLNGKAVSEVVFKNSTEKNKNENDFKKFFSRLELSIANEHDLIDSRDEDL